MMINYIGTYTYYHRGMYVDDILKRLKLAYIDHELWEKFKKLAMRRGAEVSKLLEELIQGNY